MMAQCVFIAGAGGFIASSSARTVFARGRSGSGDGISPEEFESSQHERGRN